MIDQAQQATIQELEKTHKYDESKEVISKEVCLEQMQVMENKKFLAIQAL